MIASKYEEIYPPELRDFVYITDRAYIKQQVLTMEYNILSVLSFDLTFPTAFRFLEKMGKSVKADDKIIQFATYLIELALVDMRMLRFTPSTIAGSALMLAIQHK